LAHNPCLQLSLSFLSYDVASWTKGNPEDAIWSLDAIKRTLEEMHLVGAFHLYLTGGEPFLRTDLLSIFEAAAERRIRPHIATRTNIGKFEALSELFCQVGVSELEISQYVPLVTERKAAQALKPNDGGIRLEDEVAQLADLFGGRLCISMAVSTDATNYSMTPHCTAPNLRSLASPRLGTRRVLTGNCLPTEVNVLKDHVVSVERLMRGMTTADASSDRILITKHTLIRVETALDRFDYLIVSACFRMLSVFLLFEPN
jgi:hypothetical protein